MKAILVEKFGGPEVLIFSDLPAPAPGRGEVLVALKAVGVNPVDAYIRSGLYPRKPELPYVPGTDAAGLIEAVGVGVAPFKVGDRVYIYGALKGVYAQKALVELSRVFPLPAGLTFEQGAALGVPYATAHRALFHFAQAQRGQTVLIHGASGGVGVAAVQLARDAGLNVVATAGGAEGVDFVKSLGAQHALDHREPGYQDHIAQLCGGHGPDVILEMLANVNLPLDLALAAPRGRIVVIGSRGPVSIDPRTAMSKDLSIIAMSLWNMNDLERAQTHAALALGLSSGALSPVIGRWFPLSEADRAHEAVMAPGARGKIVLIP